MYSPNLIAILLERCTIGQDNCMVIDPTTAGLKSDGFVHLERDHRQHRNLAHGWRLIMVLCTH